MEDQDLGEIHRNTGHVFNLVKIKWQFALCVLGAKQKKKQSDDSLLYKDKTEQFLRSK